MKWDQERDLLIAQTMAFMQSVTGTVAYPETPAAPPPANAPAANVVSPRDVLTPARLSSPKHSELREEIQRRVAAFRVRQQLFAYDRAEYCNATLARVRALTEQAAKASGPPIKR